MPTTHLITCSSPAGPIHLSADLGSDAHFVVTVQSGKRVTVEPESFRDVNAAYRTFCRRLTEAASGSKMKPSIHALKDTNGDFLSVPADGIRAYLEAAKRAGALEDRLTETLAVWDPSFDTLDEQLKMVSIPERGCSVAHSTTPNGSLLCLTLVDHPVADMNARRRHILKLASKREGSTTDENVEFFYDLGLAVRAYDLRKTEDHAEPTRLGMEGGGPHDHFEHRNAILLNDAISIPRDDAEQILKNMLQGGTFDECDGLYQRLNDARSAAFSGNPVKWLGSLVVTPDGSGYYSKGRTTPLTMHIRVEVVPETVERRYDGQIDFALCYFTAHYEHEAWHEQPDFQDIPYTDKGIENSINAFLRELGYDGRVNWSEHGRQAAMDADFDMDYGLLDQIFPHLRDLTKDPTPAPSA